MARHNFTRQEQKMRVITQFAIWFQRDHREVWATSYRLAKALDLSPSSHFREILNEMVREGDLTMRQTNKNGRWSGFEYTLAPNTYTLPKKRQIALNVRGKSQGQLELW